MKKENGKQNLTVSDRLAEKVREEGAEMNEETFYRELTAES
jgi:hypothetical protein